MVTKKAVKPSIIRGQIKGQVSYWLILFIAVIFSAIIFLLQSKTIHIGFTNTLEEVQEMPLLNLKKANIALLNQEKCVLAEEYWIVLNDKLNNERNVLSDQEAIQLVLDELDYKKEQNCVFSEALKIAILNYFQTKKYSTTNLLSMFSMSSQAQRDALQQEKYLQYQNEKKDLKQWVEDNLQPDESYDEVYSRELMKLQNSIFN